MAITPEEIASKEFLVGLRGYDKDEVRAYLQTVAAAFEALPAEAPAPAAAPAAAPVEGGLSAQLGQIEAILAGTDTAG